MTACPTPTKSRFATRAAAVNSSRRVDLRANLQLTPYECVCTWWHLTKSAMEEPITAAEADRATVERLASLPDIDFREIVANDVRSDGDRAERGALRHPLNQRRWKRQLGELAADIETRMSARKGDSSLEAHDWRKRTTGYRNMIKIRVEECRRLRAEAHAESVRKQDWRRRDAEIAAAAGATPKELRVHAGEIAVGRLIEAHRDEFNRYCAEEYQALGLTVPERFGNWTRDTAA
ncbi:hypothetical protein CG740_23280 [Streptomyces sp. CB01201]|uniref:hypothetical protein n=1 Tax=Streptomyces sp. CB01201 TaxID=2020324 RepID=UPI000C26DED4|nr:hypothetical protein [Streptomyces sp. CB01201]PJN00830.1 hypothetical protein CG740_23280 [Streptomyces sp. CB01201]